MTPKKAILILAVLFLATATIFFILFLDFKSAPKSSVKQTVNLKNSAADQEKLSPLEQKIKDIETKTRDQIEKIVEQGRTATGGVTPDAQKKIDEVVNQEIMEKLKLRTPEQIEADEQRQIDQEKLDQQIKSQMQK